MKCSICNKVELTGRQKYCSPGCRKKASRNQTVTNVTLKTVTPQTVTTPKVIEVEHGHWIGRPPHYPIYSECLREDCPGRNNPVPDWEPTCDKPCCKGKRG